MYKPFKEKILRPDLSWIFVAFSILSIAAGACTYYSAELNRPVIVQDTEQPINTISKTLFDGARIHSCDGRLLEVTTSRMGASPIGQVLDFRLLVDGNFEYDRYQVGIAESAIVREKSKVTATQIKKLVELLQSSDFIAAKSDYLGDYFCCDVFLKKQITFCIGDREKIINVSEYDVSIHKKRKEKLPTRLIDLIESVDRLTENGSFSASD